MAFCNNQGSTQLIFRIDKFFNQNHTSWCKTNILSSAATAGMSRNILAGLFFLFIDKCVYDIYTMDYEKGKTHHTRKI